MAFPVIEEKRLSSTYDVLLDRSRKNDGVLEEVSPVV